MRGLFVVGTGPGARERGVADAIEAAANDAGATDTRTARLGPDEPAPPAIAARHAGVELDAEDLANGVRAAAAETPDDALVVAASSGGLLAPLTERYSNRDLAGEVGLPLVVATPAASGLLNATLLTLESARGAGLTVAAVVITGWPEQPPRALLDERAMLERRLSTPVVHAPG